jgi:hypothetical protein
MVAGAKNDAAISVARFCFIFDNLWDISLYPPFHAQQNSLDIPAFDLI